MALEQRVAGLAICAAVPTHGAVLSLHSTVPVPPRYCRLEGCRSVTLVFILWLVNHKHVKIRPQFLPLDPTNVHSPQGQVCRWYI